ncbi:hypothetical protein HMPREF0391_10064 [Finegoldia magna ATCC 53516]|uniref:NADH:flavin oxidoreductase/NADH oxidase N-terminal domain-containing protein n=1 Tax=Finegoldia magna ATCC 53516 TaxID=525282 RepID=D6S6J2_FINMA|nr:hypothetical protein HMPREF0391_10064 [Finegoldia magna ATCC 53516]
MYQILIIQQTEVKMKLSDELKSKNINFKNRIVMPPMATAKADKN